MKLALPAVMAALAAPLHAQDVTNLVTGPDARISADSLAPYVEQTLAVSPQDPDNLVGASIRVDTARMVVVAVSSKDGGRTWREVPVDPCGFDPWIAFLPSGTVLLACLGPGTETQVIVMRSDDGGMGWRGPTDILPEGGSFDHPTIVADRTAGPNRGSVYVVAGHTMRSPSGRETLTAPAVVASRNAGHTFSSPVRLQATNAWAMVGSAVVMPDGALGFTLGDYAVDYRQAGGFRTLETQRVWWAESADGGRTLSMPYLIDEKEGMGWSSVAVDATTGPFAGRLYVTFQDIRDSSGGVFVSHSADGGETWSNPVRTGPPFNADSGFAFRHSHVAVNGRGEVLVAWFANAEEPGRSCGRLVASVSIDGGGSFFPPAPVADVSSCSDWPGNVVRQPGGPFGDPFDVAERWAAGGDYFGLIALPDDSFRVLWSDSRTGVFQLWTDRIVVRRSPTPARP